MGAKINSEEDECDLTIRCSGNNILGATRLAKLHRFFLAFRFLRFAA